MALFESIQMLPKHFQTIGMIQSIEIKTRLAELIMSIQSLMSDSKGYAPDPVTHDVVGRYYDYLLDSCKDRGRESINILNSRARWMLNYGELVQRYLLLDKNKRTVHNDSIILSEDENDSHLIDKITAMVESIKAYRTMPHLTSMLDDEYIKALETTLKLGRMIKPDLDNTLYARLVVMIEEITHITRYLKQCVVMGDISYESSLILKLIELNFHLREYLLKIGSRQG